MKRAHYSATLCAVASLVFFSAFTCQPAPSQSGQAQTPSSQHAASLESRLPLLFEQNAGQTNSEVRYLTRSGPYQIHLTQNAALLKIAGKDRSAVLRIAPRNANQDAAVTGADRQIAKTNYLIGSPSEWKTGIANFAAVKYEGVYPGIDLKYYGHQRQLEYDFDVAPHADPSTISLTVEGADKIATDKDGSLVLTTAAGEVRWLKPAAYQELRSGRKNVGAAYRVDGNRIFFKLGSYDRSKSLIIDPALVYGTFLDGSMDDYSSGFMVDSAGFAYITGGTTSSDFPVTPGAYQTNNTQNGKAFVSKLSQDGSSLVWSTFIGGTGPDSATYPSGLTLDADGNVYLVGTTGDFTNGSNGQTIPQLSTFPTSPGAYNRTELAGWREFLVKLNNTGTAVDFSTFLSSQPNVIPYAVAIDVASNVYVTGYYSHASGQTAAFPATPGAYQSTWGGDKDAFVMKFNPTGTGLVYATLVGGQYDDSASQISVDAYGDATINGPTYSPNYPITPNGLRQASEAGGFITTLNPTGSGLTYSTVLNNVLSINLKRDTAGYYYAGGSAGLNLPTTANAFQRTFPSTGSGTHEGFLTEIDPSGTLVYSSYLGGNVYLGPGVTEDTQVLLVSPGSVVMGGDRSDDSTFPVTDRTYEQDDCSFLAKFDTQASGAASLLYSGCTPVNGTNNITLNLFRGIGSFSSSQLYIDADDNLYALNRNGPTSANAFQPKPNPSEGDGAYIWFGKYNLSQAETGGINLSNPASVNSFPYGNPVEFRATGRSPQCSAGVAAMRVYTAPGVAAYTTLNATLDANITFPVSGTGILAFNPTIVVYDNCGKAFSLTIPIAVEGSTVAPPNPEVVSPTNGVSYYAGYGPVGAVTSPVHFVASATASSCSKGVSAMRIYTAPGVNAYTTSGGSLDTYLKMANGTYNVTVQAWDNCGNVYKTPLQVTVE